MQNRNLTILLVDDDSNERSGVRFLIEQGNLPLDILEAPNGKRALEIIHQKHVDILFTDVKMPYMDGLELSSNVYRAFPHIKIIVFSAYGEFEYAKKAMEAKAVNYLLKPVDVQEFQEVIKLIITRCYEEAELDREKQKRILADKKLQWIHILMGKRSVDDELIADLTRQGYPVDGEMTLIHMETQGDFFAKFEQSVLDCLAQNTPCQYEYVNVYPNSSYTILFKALKRDTLTALCRKLSECTAGTEEQISFLVSDLAFPLAELAKQVHDSVEMGRRMFMWDEGVVFMSDLTKLNQGIISDVQQEWNDVDQAVRSRDKVSILKSVNALLESMMSHSIFSTAYIYHIFCDLFGKLYTEYGYTDSRGLERAINELGCCRSRQSILLLVSAVLDELKQNKGDEQDVSYVIQKVKRIIQNQYSDDLSLEYLAHSVGLAPSYLSYVFKRETGENLVKYLTDYRLHMAKQMLDDHKLKIVQIGKQCGYENQSYFNRLFKNAYGMTPKQYREKNND